MELVDSGLTPEGNKAVDPTADPNVVGSNKDNGKGLQADQVYNATGFNDEIRTLKARLLELEQHAGTTPTDPEQASHRHVTAEIERHKKMEACLYRHRKEWETNTGPGAWGFHVFSRWYMKNDPEEHWVNKSRLFQENEFTRPDLFGPSHRCEEGQENSDAENNARNEDYDRTINYGERRERLRKCFEWDLDRLWLDEEMARRRREKFTGVKKPEENPNKEPEKFAEARLNRLDWSSFKKLAAIKEKDACVLDILKGEPMIDDDIGGYRSWYGYAGRRARKLDTSQDLDSLASMAIGQPPLPERIRVHSAALVGILTIILGKSSMPPEGSTALVFIRPFKALAYREQALRDWCIALEKKFNVLSNSEKDLLAAQDGTVTNTQMRDSHSVQEAGIIQSPVPADEGLLPQNTQKETPASDEGKSSTKTEQGDNVTVDNDSQDPRAGKEGDEEHKSEEDDLTKSLTALKHLRCLLDFFDTDVKPKQAFLSSQECRKVFFSDLWLLFRPGMEVIGSDGKQAYRVIDVSSAKHRVVSAWDRWYNFAGDSPAGDKGKKRKPAFSITCVYIDFDGVRLGPVQKIFEFKSFDQRGTSLLWKFIPCGSTPRGGLTSVTQNGIRSIPSLRMKDTGKSS